MTDCGEVRVKETGLANIVVFEKILACKTWAISVAAFRHSPTFIFAKAHRRGRPIQLLFGHLPMRDPLSFCGALHAFLSTREIR